MAVVVRDLAYMYRIKVLTSNELNWRRAFDVIMLWEFASAVAPMILGGGFAFAILIISKEKIAMGKSISVVMFTSFLDGLFFAVMAPLVYFSLGYAQLFANIDPASLEKISYGKQFFFTFWLIYGVVMAYKVLVAYALFINPRAIKYLLVKLFSFRFLRRWKLKAADTGTEMAIAATELKGKSWNYWLQAIGATFVSWTARYIIVNCIVMAFSTVDIGHWILYARQVVMGLLMLSGFTPGGSGLAEGLFSNFLGEFIPTGLAPTLAFIWRIISYYPYLFIGAIVLPRWIKRVFTQQ
jgi:hypothetical protein